MEAGGPGIPWTLDQVFMVSTDGSQDLVLTTARIRSRPPPLALLGLTAAQVRAQFGPLAGPPESNTDTGAATMRPLF